MATPRFPLTPGWWSDRGGIQSTIVYQTNGYDLITDGGFQNFVYDNNINKLRGLKTDAVYEMGVISEAKVGDKVNISNLKLTDDQVNNSLGTISIPAETDTMTLNDSLQTLSNKTLTTPQISSIYADAGKTQLHNIPAVGNDTFSLLNASQQFKNKELQDANCFIVDSAISGKKLAFECKDLTNPSTRTITMVDGDITILGQDYSQQMSNKRIYYSSQTQAISKTLSGTDADLIVCTGLSADITITLPVIGSGQDLREFCVLNCDASWDVKIQTQGPDTISPSITSVTLDSGEMMKFYCLASCNHYYASTKIYWKSLFYNPAGTFYSQMPALTGNDILVSEGHAATLTNKTFTDNVTFFQDDLDNTKKGKFDLSLITSGNTREYKLPDSDGTICLTSGVSNEFNDSLWRVFNNVDNTKKVALDVSGVTTGNVRTLSVPNSDGKLLTDAEFSIPDHIFKIYDGGDSSRIARFNLDSLSSATHNYSLPYSGEISHSILTDKSVNTVISKYLRDSDCGFYKSTDGTSRLRFDCSVIGAASTRVITPLNENLTLVGVSNIQTLTNKTLTAPVISTISNTGTLTLPTSTDTLLGRATTDTLTNKTLTTPVIASLYQDAGKTKLITMPAITSTLAVIPSTYGYTSLYTTSSETVNCVSTSNWYLLQLGNVLNSNGITKTASPLKLTIPTAAYYKFHFTCKMSQNQTATVLVSIQKNDLDTTYMTAQVINGSTVSMNPSIHQIVNVATNDYFKVAFKADQANTALYVNYMNLTIEYME